MYTVLAISSSLWTRSLLHQVMEIPPAGGVSLDSAIGITDHDAFELAALDGFYIPVPQGAADVGGDRLGLIIDDHDHIAPDLRGFDPQSLLDLTDLRGLARCWR